LLWFITIGDKDEIVKGPGVYTRKEQEYTSRSRTYIKALVDDNPVYVATDYKAQLQNLPEPLRSQMLLADMSAGMEDAEWQIIPSDWLRAAMDRWKKCTEEMELMIQSGEEKIHATGLDIARGGLDKTAICNRYGSYFQVPIVVPGKFTPHSRNVMNLLLKHVPDDSSTICLDALGVGTAVKEAVEEVYKSYKPIISSGKAFGRDKSGRYLFKNIRAKLWWNLREALHPDSGENLCIPDTPGIFKDLTAPIYKVTGNVIRCELKEDIKKRIQRSPDEGESLIYSLYTKFFHTDFSGFG